MLEVISYANALKAQDRIDTLFPDQVYATPDLKLRFNNKDMEFKTSPYYIRKKMEIGKLLEQFCAEWIKIVLMIILSIYMYGAMCLKYASGAESFVTAISFTAFGDTT